MTKTATCPHCLRAAAALEVVAFDDVSDDALVASRRAAVEQQQLIEGYLAAMEEFYELPKGTQR